MAVWLAIAACGPQLEVALAADAAGVPSLVRLAGESPRSTLLLAAIDLLVEDAGLTPERIERVVVSRGPGSFTGIRAGLATAAGLAAATDCEPWAYDSLTAQAARCSHAGVLWAAQPGRRGEVYDRPFRLEPHRAPTPAGAIEILPLTDLREREPWVAAERLDLGAAKRLVPIRSAAEALLLLSQLDVPSDVVEPLFVEGPPIHRGETDG